MARILLFFVLCCLGAATLAACGGGGDSTGNECFLDEGRFRDLSATPGTAPRFSWCGAPAKSLLVRRPAGANVWAIECGDSPPLCIDPVVAYGDTVTGTTVPTPAQPLQAGETYEFCLSGLDDRPPTVCQSFTS
jgi:hypothetical protein